MLLLRRNGAWQSTAPSTGDFTDIHVDLNKLRVLYDEVMNLEDKYFQTNLELKFYDDIYIEDETELRLIGTTPNNCD